MPHIIYIQKANVKDVQECHDHPIYYDIKSATDDGVLHGYAMQVTSCKCRSEVHMEVERPRFYTSYDVPRDTYTEGEYIQIAEAVGKDGGALLVPTDDERIFRIMPFVIGCHIIDAPEYYFPGSPIHCDICFHGKAMYPVEKFDGYVQIDGSIMEFVKTFSHESP